MIRWAVFAIAVIAPLAVAQETAKPAAPKLSPVQMARQNLDAVAPVPAVAPRPQLALPVPTFLEFPLCSSFPGGPSLLSEGGVIMIRMRPGDAPLSAAQGAPPASAPKGQ
jgi:hypothetical protein